MKIEVNIKKKYVFMILGAIIILAISVGVYATWDSAKTVSHSAEDIKVTIDGEDYNLQEVVEDLKAEIENAGSVVTGEYIGTGEGGQTILIPSKPDAQPKMVWVAQKFNQGMPIYRINNGQAHSECSDATERWCIDANPGDLLLAIPGGFKVTTHRSMNANGYGYEYVLYY